MSVDYTFYPRSYIGKYVHDIEVNGSYQGYRISQADILCSVVGLPQIPYYYCSEDSFPIINSVNSDRYWRLYFKMNSKYSRYDLHSYIGISNRDKLKPVPISKRYKAYVHWQKWGLKKLEALTPTDILSNPQIKRKDIYGDSSCLEEIKRDIKQFLWYYKNHYYMFSLV